MSNAPAPKSRGGLIWIAPVIVTALLAWGGWSRHVAAWRPDTAKWPVQGVALSKANQPVDWRRVAREGASFAYIGNMAYGDTLATYSDEMAAARRAGLKTGPIYRFSLCAADDQGGNFVTSVARDSAMLPSIIMLDRQEGCDRWPTRAKVISELTTFLTQVETHLGRSAVIAPDADFEDYYTIASAIDRPVMVRRNRSAPEEDGGGWAIWQANDSYRIDGVAGEIRWLVGREDDIASGGDRR